MIARALLGASGVVAAVLLAVSLGAARAEERAKRVAFSHRAAESEPRAIRRALSDARAARRLAPDSGARLTEAFVLARAARRREASRVLERLVRDEPENVDAWVSLSNATTDHARASAARRRARELDPLLARSR